MTKIRSNIFIAIFFMMLCYWILINAALFITAIINSNQWLLVSGFNIGFMTSVIGFWFLFLAGKWLTSGKPFRQTLAYLLFLVRMIIYGSVIVLIIFFNFANMFTTIFGMSILMLATISAHLGFCLPQNNSNNKQERNKQCMF